MDGQAGQAPPLPANNWEGVGISMAANSYYGAWCCAPNWSNGFQLRGPMGVDNNCEPAVDYAWLWGGENNSSTMTKPAETVLLHEKHGQDISLWNTTYDGSNPNFTGNWSNFGPEGITGGPVLENVGWGPQNIPNGTFAAGGFDIGPNGAVSAKFANLACFVFCDGHAKAMNPVATDPDPVNLPQNNMWDGMR
jgi:hypothetical protein